LGPHTYFAFARRAIKRAEDAKNYVNAMKQAGQLEVSD
jgi:hypothetical protein